MENTIKQMSNMREEEEKQVKQKRKSNPHSTPMEVPIVYASKLWEQRSKDLDSHHYEHTCKTEFDHACRPCLLRETECKRRLECGVYREVTNIRNELGRQFLKVDDAIKRIASFAADSGVVDGDQNLDESSESHDQLNDEELFKMISDERVRLLRKKCAEQIRKAYSDLFTTDGLLQISKENKNKSSSQDEKIQTMHGFIIDSDGNLHGMGEK